MVDPELVAIGAEAPARLTDLGVMPEPSGEGEEPQPNAGAQARECAGAVALEAEPSLAGPKDRFDPLAHAPERSELERLVLAIGTNELGSAIHHNRRSWLPSLRERPPHTPSSPGSVARPASNQLSYPVARERCETCPCR